MAYVTVGVISVAFVSSLLGTLCVYRLAMCREWIGQKSPHHSHDGDIPRIGGIGILAGFVAAIVTGLLLSTNPLRDGVRLGAILVSASAVFSLGLFDDFRPLRPWMKLLVQAGAGVVAFQADLRLDHIGVLPFAMPGWLALATTVFWFVSLCNAYNLVDGLDGLAAGIGAISATAFAVWGMLSGEQLMVILGVALAGALLGFLPLNFHPARTFMGDCGSLLIGALIAAMTLIPTRHENVLVVILAMVLICAVPVLDMTLAVLRRAFSGHHIMSPDCGHVHHRLLYRGSSIRMVALFLYAASAFFAVCGTLLITKIVPAVVTTVVSCGAILLGLVTLKFHRDFRFQNSKLVDSGIVTGRELRKVRAASAATAQSVENESVFVDVLMARSDGQSSATSYTD